MPNVERSIAHLDFPVCECQMDTCGGQCANEATYRIDVHALDHCHHPSNELDKDGNRTFVLCAPCYQTIRGKVAGYVARRGARGLAQCFGCGAPVTCVKQVIREAKKL